MGKGKNGCDGDMAMSSSLSEEEMAYAGLEEGSRPEGVSADDAAELEALLSGLAGLEGKVGDAEVLLAGLAELLGEEGSEQMLSDIDQALLDLRELRSFLEGGSIEDYDRFRLLRAQEIASALAVGGVDSLGSPPSPDQMAQLLGFPSAARVPGSAKAEKRVATCILARLCRLNHFSKGLTADYLRYHLNTRFKPQTLDKWCAPAELHPWYSRTESIELRDGSEDYEIQRARWLGWGSRVRGALKMREINEDTLDALVQERSDDLFEAAQDKLRSLMKKSFHKVAFHKPAEESANAPLIEELFTRTMVKGVLDEVAHAHCAADARTAVEKPFEHGIRGGLARMTGVKVEVEESRSDPMDVRFTANSKKRKLTAQVKTRYSTTPDTAEKRVAGHESELERHSFNLFDTGPDEAADGKKLAQKAADRLDDTDLYIECSVLDVNDGLTDDDQPDTTKYALDVMRKEVKDELANQLRGHDFDVSSKLEVSGVVMVNGRQIPWKATVSKSGNGVKVSLSPQAMEPTVTLSAASPEVASGLVFDEAMRSYSGKA